MTPEEFVRAGDYLVNTCPTWNWEAGDQKKVRSFLPVDKQYLVTRNVPCLQRACALEEYGQLSEQVVAAQIGTNEEEDDGWVTAVGNERSSTSKEKDIPTIGDVSAANNDIAEDIPDFEDLELADEDDDEAACVVTHADANHHEGIVKTRTYDLLITYDKYYQTPRIWLLGYDENRQPLPPSAVLEDVSVEHAHKTVTVEPHPHSSAAVAVASIHPCKHAHVMHTLVEVVTSGGSEFHVDRYLVLFLKFIASIIPTINYDFTLGVGS